MKNENIVIIKKNGIFSYILKLRFRFHIIFLLNLKSFLHIVNFVLDRF